VKAVEVGEGCAVASKKGSEINDPMDAAGFVKNSAGGILAGITTGQDLVFRVYCNPLPSIALPQQTVDESGRERSLLVGGRHDICVIPRIVPVCEAMVLLELADHWLRQKAGGR
jgi:chorismate synthase